MNNPALTVEKKILQQKITHKSRSTRRPRDYQQISLYKDINPLDWEDWHWQVRNRVCSKEQLAQIIKLTPEEEKGIKGRIKEE